MNWLVSNCNLTASVLQHSTHVLTDALLHESAGFLKAEETCETSVVIQTERMNTLMVNVCRILALKGRRLCVI